MAWVERRGSRYRVRYWTPEGHAATAGVFATRDAAKDHADTLTTPPALPTPHPATHEPTTPHLLGTPTPPSGHQVPPRHAVPPGTPTPSPLPGQQPPTGSEPGTPSWQTGWASHPTPAPLLLPTQPPPLATPPSLAARRDPAPQPPAHPAQPPHGLATPISGHYPTPTATSSAHLEPTVLIPTRVITTTHPDAYASPDPESGVGSSGPLTTVPTPHNHPTQQGPVHEVLLADWVQVWWLTLEIGPNTTSHYRSLLRNHILPRWGAMPMHLIAPSDVTFWLKALNERYARATVTSIGKLLALVLAAAVTERHLAANPVHLPRRRGRERDHQQEDQMWATEHEVITLARRITHLAGPTQGLLIITAAYTGMRWGELAALTRAAHNHSAATLTVHRDTGNLLEVDGRHSYGPPKTAASVRTVTLPPFLSALLQQDQSRHTHQTLFTSLRGNNLRRSTFSRRLWAPATRGTTLPDGIVWPPLKAGLTFHNLRHTHKTWLIEDHIPDVAQARRLGHTLKGIDDVYAHVADSVDARLLTALEARWHRSLTRHALPDATSGPEGP
ncbi:MULTISPECIES: tyrosine-type recombinase/integrase [unclassified Streptomyces]|uniref:tyrosine-type recombinase/integrase n=1 Tax=unclassified Streptomyces TaxID=2593676 RepID=UPI002E18B87C|nr:MULTISPECIES: tyrosine-type recombinase/integrase [unclassified Streptomyces]